MYHHDEPRWILDYLQAMLEIAMACYAVLVGFMTIFSNLFTLVKKDLTL